MAYEVSTLAYLAILGSFLIFKIFDSLIYIIKPQDENIISLDKKHNKSRIQLVVIALILICFFYCKISDPWQKRGLIYIFLVVILRICSIFEFYDILYCNNKQKLIHPIVKSKGLQFAPIREKSVCKWYVDATGLFIKFYYQQNTLLM